MLCTCRSLLKTVFCTLVLVSLMAVSSLAQGFRNLGPQILASVIQGSTIVKSPQGEKLVYTVVRGNPAHFLGYRVNDGKLIVDQILPDTDGAWDLVQSTDGSLYIPGGKGRLFRHLPGTQEVLDLGIALQGETTIWSLTAGKDGEIFGATYPGCRVFRYHPNSGFSDVKGGPLVEGENYVRTISYHRRSGKLFAGVGSHAHLIELDPATGKTQELLPEEYQSMEFVYGLELLEGAPGGDRLLTLLTNGSITLVYNIATRQFESKITEMDMKAIGYREGASHYFATSKGGLYQRSLDGTAPRLVLEEAGSANTFAIDTDEIILFNPDAELISYHSHTGTSKKIKLKVPGQPISIQSIMKGPDGRIWSGGYLAGGHAAFDPKTGEVTGYPGLHQTEGMTLSGRNIYFGIYPKGQYFKYDVDKPWDVKVGNPKFLGQIPGQSRSFAVLNVAALKRIYFGMVPEYGHLGGDLVYYDTESGKLKSYGPIVKDQSIVSLVQSRGLIWGGTTVSGGLGALPTTENARLFAWDPKLEKIVFETTPIEGAKAITSMIIGPDENIWGMAGGTLFIIDPETRNIVKQKVLYPTPPLKSHVWRDAFLLVHPNGKIYGTGNNVLFSLDPKTLELTELSKPASLLAMDDEGRIYFHRSAELWQYSPR